MRRTLTTLLLALAAAAALPAAASTTVSVDLVISSNHYNVKEKTCAVAVAAGSDGTVVLRAAQSAGCITSFKTSTHSFGTFVDCINGRCGDGAPTYLRYWAMRENCAYTSYGVDGFRADHGDELSLTFEPWPISSLPVVC